jgi:hypothetical protein
MQALFTPLFLLFTLLTTVTAYYPQGTITAPANGTRIAPGARFDFKYNIRSDYCLSSLNYTVWLFTSSGGPSQAPFLALEPENQFATGHFFGRFQEQSYASKSVVESPVGGR